MDICVLMTKHICSTLTLSNMVNSLLPPEIEAVQRYKEFLPKYIVLSSGNLKFLQFSTDYIFISERGREGRGT